MHYTQSPGPVEGREEFIEANAVALVEEKEAMIERLRQRVRKLERSARDLRTEANRLQAIIMPENDAADKPILAENCHQIE